MKRPLLICMAALLAGIYVAYFVPDSISFLFLGFLVLVFLVLLVFKKRVIVWLLLVLFFLFGALYLQESDDIEKRPMHAFVNEYVTVSCDVTEKVKREDDGTQTAVVRVTSLSFLNKSIYVNERVRMKIPSGEELLSFGDRFSAICLFSVPAGRQNTGTFDYELYLKSKKIFYLGKVEPGTLEKTGTFSLSFTEKLYALNQRCGQVISSLMPEEAAGILRGISFGDKSEISDDLYEALQIAGLSHVVAVSGMHVTTFLSIIFVFLTVLKRNKYQFFLPICGVILLFMLFTGVSPSVIRATIMSGLALVAFLFFRKEDSYTSLGLAAGVIVLLNPFAAFDVGFILSFGATLGILLFATPIQKFLFNLLALHERKGFWAELGKGILSLLCVTFSVQLFLLPVLSVMFGYTSLWCFLTNLLVAPLFCVLLVGGLLIGFLGLIHPSLALPVAGGIYPFVKMVLWIVHLFGRLDFGVLTTGAFGLFGFYVYGMLLFSFRQFLARQYFRALALAAGIPVLLACYLVVQALCPKAEVTFINVGQGDCAFIQLPGDITVLVDGGGVTYDTDYDVGTEVVLPYLKRAGIRRLTYMIASHPHGDHIGGLKTVMEEIPVENLLVPIGFDGESEGQDFLTQATNRGMMIQVLEAGDIISLNQDSCLEILMPDWEWLSLAESENDRSLVFRFCYGSQSVLFMGDLEQDGETYLVGSNQNQLATTVLKAGHHGSANATSTAFLSWAKPRYAFISCGKNHFGHPSVEVLSRLAVQDTIVYRADEDCDVTFIFNQNRVQSIIKGGQTP